MRYSSLTLPCCATIKTCPTSICRRGRLSSRGADVTLGETQNGKTQILTGLQASDRVVGDGSLFLQFQNSLQR